jgi:hypothetical protein
MQVDAWGGGDASRERAFDDSWNQGLWELAQGSGEDYIRPEWGKIIIIYNYWENEGRNIKI